MLSTIFALMLMQVGPFPNAGPMPGVDEALRDRSKRQAPAAEVDESQVPRERGELARCLMLAGSDPDEALDRAQGWRTRAADETELAQSAHCLGLALVRLQRFDEARQSFEIGSAEAPANNPAYRARLAAMAGNAALADGKAAVAEPLFAGAVAYARSGGDAALAASLQLDQARALVALDRRDEAAAALAAARGEDPSNAQAWLLSATLARRMERLGEAQTLIQQAAALDPGDPAIGLEAGVIAALAGRAEDARRSFASVIEVAADSEEAARARSYLDQLGQ